MIDKRGLQKQRIILQVTRIITGRNLEFFVLQRLPCGVFFHFEGDEAKTDSRDSYLVSPKGERSHEERSDE